MCLVFERLCLQGSDIETLGSETAVEYGAELLECPLVQEPEAQDVQTSVSAGKAPSSSFFLSRCDFDWSLFDTTHIYVHIDSCVCRRKDC